MIVYLLRHGIAENSSPTGRDADRELTHEGHERLSEVLTQAHKSGVKPHVILTSPYKRALQTARLASKIFCGPAPEIREALVPHGNPREIWQEIRAQEDVDELLLAGHEPLLSQAASYLLNSPSLCVDMKKAALLAIEFGSLRGEPRGILRWMLTPKVSA